MSALVWRCVQLVWLPLLVRVAWATYLGPRRTVNQTSQSLQYPREPDFPRRPGQVEMMGPACTALGRRCLRSARCLYQEQRCQCSSVMPVGDGLMECTKEGNMICRVDCDPKVHAWKRARAPINLPCWYRVTRFLAPMKPQPVHSIYKWCKVQVRVLNTLTNKGLFFVGTVVVDVWIAGIDAGKFHLHADSKKRYEVTYLMARQSIHTKNDPWTAWLMRPRFYEQEAVLKAFPDKFPVVTFWDPGDRFAVLRIPQCNVQVKYRPFGDSQPQVLKPGVVVTVPKTHLVRFEEPYMSSVCLTPRNSSSTYWRDALRWKLRNPAQVALLYVLLQKDLRSSLVKNPKYHAQCLQLRFYLQSKFCRAERSLVIQLCGPLLKMRHTFINCLGPDQLMEVAANCVSWACFGVDGGKELACQAYLQALQKKGCRPTPLMQDIGCDEDKRQFFRDHVFNPSPPIDSILGY